MQTMRTTTNTLSATLLTSTVPTGLRIEAWDAAGICPDLIDVAAPDARGRFTMKLDAEYVEQLLPRKAPALAFRIFENGKPLSLTQPITWTVSQQLTRLQLPLANKADPTVAAQTPGQATIRGTVSHGDGSPGANVTVRAFDRNLAAKGFSERQLAQATTATDGSYTMSYSMPAGGKLKPDLIVRAIGAATSTTPTAAAPPPAVLAESPLVASAPTVALVDLSLDQVVDAQPSEHSALTTAVAPILARAKLDVADLAPEHIAYVAETSGVQDDRIDLMRQAGQLARSAGGGMTPDVFYGLLATGHRGDLNDLAAVPLDVQRPRLETAIDQNLLPATLAPKLEDTLATLRDRIVALALPAGGNTPISAVLGNALAGTEIQTEFVRQWVGRTGGIDEFWTAVRADSKLGPSADDLETTVRLDQLFSSSQPALAELRARRQAKSITGLRDLARWQDADWQSFWTKVGSPADATVPPQVRAMYPTEFLRGRAAQPVAPLATNFVQLLAAANPSADLSRALPTNPSWGSIAPADQAAARTQWNAFASEARTFRHTPARTLLATVVASQGANPARSDANRFLTTSTVDLELTSFDRYVAANPASISAIPADRLPTVVAYLKGVQRILRVVPDRPDAVETILADGVDSAQRVVAMSPATFGARYGAALGGADAAQTAYAKAFRAAATAQLALTTTAQGLAGTNLWAVNGGSRTKHPAPDVQSAYDLLKAKSGASTATWPTLFSGEAWCECDDCSSAYSPAAYFCDLLHTSLADPSHEPTTILFQRRPDLPNIALTCDNTNTPLPYIDVVNEVLELFVASSVNLKDSTGQPYSRATSYDSTGLSAAELRAVPQNVIDGVYEPMQSNGGILDHAVFPFTLPFRRSLAVMRAYLDQLGTSYDAVLQAFGPPSDGTLTLAQRRAAETFAISELQYQVIAGMTVPNVDLAACYGTQDLTSLQKVPTLLQTTATTYADLSAIAASYFLTAGAASLVDPATHCEVDDLLFHPTSDDTWNRLHRFIRLWRATGWSVADVDRAIFAVGGALDADGLSRVALAHRVVDALAQPLAPVLALWADLDTWGDDSLYLALFQNRSVARLEDAPAFALSQTRAPSGVFELADPSKPVVDHEATILAALKITAADLDAVRSHAFAAGSFQPPPATNDATLLNLHDLTVLYRYTVLATGLGMRVSDLVTLLELTGATPFTDPQATLDFIALAHSVTASGMSIAALDYAFRCNAPPGLGPAPAPSVMYDALAKIWSALRGVREDTAITDDPDGTLLAARLALILTPDVVKAVIAALDPVTPPQIPANQRDAYRTTVRKQVLSDALAGVLGATAFAPIQHQVIDTPDPAPDDQTGLVARKVANQAVVLAAVSLALRASLSRAAVISTVATTLGLSDALARSLLTDYLPAASGTSLDTLLALTGGGLVVQSSDATATGDTIALKTAGATATWRGYLLPLGDGAHQLVLRSDGACSIAIGTASATTFAAQTDGLGRPLLVDNVFTTTLVANQLVPITVSYDSGGKPGSFALLWKLATATAAAAPVTPEYLFAQLAALDGNDASAPGYVWRRAHKASLLVLGLSLTDDEVALGETDIRAAAASGPFQGPFGELRLRDLPMTPPSDADAQHAIAQWLRLAAFVAVRASLPSSDVSLADVLLAIGAASDPPTRWRDLLCSATGWDPLAVTPLLSTPSDPTSSGAQIVAELLVQIGGPIATLPTAPPSPNLELGRRLAALQSCLDLVKRIGQSSDVLTSWAASEPDRSAARAVVQAVRARYPVDSDWYQVAQTRNDKLRQQQRDALVGYILPRFPQDPSKPPVTTSDDLYEQLLIDVEMCACGTTSRVLQGISSVQLFIQRILLGLEEPDLHSNLIDPDRWQWNEQYRIWQANREIFLYPENWIDPELRVDKSPFFADLQNDLSQGPLDAPSIETAFESYLLKLDQVARLKVCALHWQREGKAPAHESALKPDKSIDTLHVIARTPGAQPTYFYRTLLGTAGGGGGTEWTPWEKIELDIGSDGDTGDLHMIVTTFDRRLYLFWAQLTEIAEPDQPGANLGESPLPPLTHWEIRLAWATYRDGKWSAKQVTSDYIRSNRFVTQGDLKLYKNEVNEFDHEVKKAKHQFQAADAAATLTETALWMNLTLVRGGMVLAAMTYDPSPLGNALQVAIKLTDSQANSLEDIEQTIEGSNLTFADWLKRIYDQVAAWHAKKSSVPLITNPTQKQLEKEYAKLQRQRDRRDGLQATFDALERGKQNFDSGTTGLAIPSATTRADHTLWLASDSDRVEIKVLRHDDKANPLRIGMFRLSADGRSVAVVDATGYRKDLSRDIPRHSTAAINAYAIDTSHHPGLDFEGIQNLLASVDNANFYGEHWLDHAVSADSPRPFVIEQGSDVEIALPDRPQKADEPPAENRSIGGIVLPASIPATPPATPPPLQTISAAADTTTTTDSAYDANALINADKSFGLSQLIANLVPDPHRGLYCFEPLCHPFVRTLIKRLERDGVAGLLARGAQDPSGSDGGEALGHFDSTFEPSKRVAYPYSPYDIDFRSNGPYSLYNWELFFHAPMLIASRLMQDAQYETARDWLHYIFDPTTTVKEDAPARFWNFLPFRTNQDTLDIDQLMSALAVGEPKEVVDEFKAEIDQWIRYPADPHRIARLRIAAYQKAVVFKYLDNLIAWGDSLFTQNTIETINQATQLYVFALQLLGPRPEQLPPQTNPISFTYAAVADQLDTLSDMVDEVEAMSLPAQWHDRTALPESSAYSLIGIPHFKVGYGTPQVTAQPLQFCVPPNTKILGYFTTLDDRLFKIRNCMNIEGVVQQLPLFQPPIDPALLVRAAAMGLDLSSVLADLTAPLPFHRYSVMTMKALEMCNELKALGAQLLAALEKQDAETLAVLRATQDRAVQTAIMAVRKQQLQDTQVNKTALQRSRDIAQAKYTYYSTRPFMNALEDVQAAAMAIGLVLDAAAAGTSTGASFAHAAVSVQLGPTGMGVHATAEAGGPNAGHSANAASNAVHIGASIARDGAALAGLFGGFQRRSDDWQFQAQIATKEMAQIDQQLASADIKIAIANLDITNQQLMIDNAQKIEDTLRSKYTNVELYQWMVGQISTTYYQAYKLAYDLAKRAERCYQYELGVSSSFIQFGYWDSMRKGLHAGEQLALDLKRMDASYLQTERRELEITRQISLVLADPQAFMDLRENGTCELVLPEELFDADYPGHYFRRIKTVSLTLPCVAGPYTAINCTLTLLDSTIRTSASAGSGANSYPEQNAPNDARFTHTYGAIQSVATSHGQNDAGLFEVNFRDERYLPFEGAGAISRWRIDLPRDTNAFDFDTLSDAIVKISYTARDGGAPLATAARASLKQRRGVLPSGDPLPYTPLRRLFRVRYEFSDAWIAFRNAASGAPATLQLTIDQDRFPYAFRGAKLAIQSAKLYAVVAGLTKLTLAVTPPLPGQPSTVDLVQVGADPSVLEASIASGAGLGTWSFTTATAPAAGSVRDLVLVVTYTAG
jgi:hypothetical protein